MGVGLSSSSLPVSVQPPALAVFGGAPYLGEEAWICFLTIVAQVSNIQWSAKTWRCSFGSGEMRNQQALKMDLFGVSGCGK